MVTYDTSFRLHTTQHARIYEDLRLIGPGPAAFYRDACRIMEAEPPFEAATHLVSHCLREFESALRDVLRPVAEQLFPPTVSIADTTHSTKGKQKASGEEKDGHKKDIRQILYALAIPETDQVTHQWLLLAPKREKTYGFASRAHRNKLAEPRPLDDEFRRLWHDMNAVLERVLDAFKARYLTTHQLIDTRLVQGTDSLDSRMEFLKEHIPHNPVSLSYFFTRIGEQQAIEWVAPLREAGYFGTPPAPDYDPETKTTRHYPWPASQYLAQMAKLLPQQVLEIICDIPPTENVQVYQDCIDAACQMPAAIAQQLVPRVIDWLHLPYQGFLADKAGALIDYLSLNGERDAALRLFAAFLDQFPDRRSTRDPWDYARILKQTLPALVTAGDLPVLVLLAHRLEESLPSDESEGAILYRSSSFWRPVIEAAGDERLEERGGLCHLLISLLRQAAELAIQQQQATVREILVLLQAHSSRIFTRLALYFLSRFPEQAPETVTSFLTDQHIFAHAEVRREYVLLLQATFGKLAPADREIILGWIEQGPGDIAEERAAYEQYTHEPFTDEMEAHHIQQWQRDWYARLGAALPAALQQRYEVLVQDCGPATLPVASFPRASAVRWEAVLSPKTVEDLCAMRVRELVAFLKNWQPVQSDELLQPSSSIQGLIETLNRAAATAPLHFSRYARQFRALSPNYIEAILKGLIQASRQHQTMSWKGVLDLCLSVTHKRTRRAHNEHSRTQPQWKDACWQVIELLALGCAEASSNLPLTLREQVWAILYPLTQDSNPTPEEEQRFASDRSDRIDFAEATVRGKALFGVLAYAEWVMRLLNQQSAAKGSEQHQRLEPLPEVRAVLESHLDSSSDPSLAVRSFYGQALPRLVQLDPSWVEQQLDRLFPRSEATRPYRQAVWDAYGAFWRPGTTLYTILQGVYRDAIDELEASTQVSASLFQPEGQLVHHLVWLTCRGMIALNEPDGLLDHFFAKASAALRRFFWEDIGLDLVRRSDPLAPEMLTRLQALWEWRITTLTQQSQQGTVETEELAPFGWWFKSGKLLAEWSLQQLEATLQLHGTVNAPSTIAEHLAELSEAAPFAAVRCLSLLVRSTRDDWKPSAWPQQVRTILRNALSSESNKAQELAREVRHRLGAQGETYPEVL